MLSPEEVDEIADEVVRVGAEEPLSLTLTVELSAAERAERPFEVQQVVDALRARGGSPAERGGAPVGERRGPRGVAQVAQRGSAWLEEDPVAVADVCDEALLLECRERD